MTMTKKTIESLRTEQITPEGTTGKVTGDRVEAAALPAPSKRVLEHRGEGIWGSLAGMVRNFVRGERSGLVPAEAASEDPPVWLGAN